MSGRNWWFNPWRRKIDTSLLWPAIKTEALKRDRTLDEAKAVFAMHVFHDDAWADLGDKEIKRRIDELT
jgi:hypothetical protein